MHHDSIWKRRGPRWLVHWPRKRSRGQGPTLFDASWCLVSSTPIICSRCTRHSWGQSWSHTHALEQVGSGSSNDGTDPRFKGWASGCSQGGGTDCAVPGATRRWLSWRFAGFCASIGHCESAWGKIERSRMLGLLIPDYCEKSQMQSRRTSQTTADDIVKVDVTIAPGLQVKDPSRRPKRCTTLGVSTTSGTVLLVHLIKLPAIWARLWCFEERTKDGKTWQNNVRMFLSEENRRTVKIRKVQTQKYCNWTACCLELYTLEPGTRLGKYRLEQRSRSRIN